MSRTTEARKRAFAALRRRAREAVVQVLYQEDVNAEIDPAAGDVLLHRELRFEKLARSACKELTQLARQELLSGSGKQPPQVAPGELIERAGDSLRAFVREGDLIDFAQSLLAGVRRHRAQLDQTFERVADHWSLKRMAATDRNVLRLGAYELLHTNTPDRVALDEAVELAKRFGSAQSGPFVNGILDRLMHSAAGKGEGRMMNDE